MTDGTLEEGRLAFRDALGWQEQVNPNDIAALLEGPFQRIHDDLRVGQWGRARSAVVILRDGLPHQHGELVERLTGVYRKALGVHHTSEEIQVALRELRGVFEGSPAPIVEVSGAAPDVESDVIAARAIVDPEVALGEFRRYFPHTPGTRWVYRRGDGRVEERRIISLTPVENEGWKVGIRVKVEGGGDGFVTTAYLVAGDLILNHPRVPPGDLVLRQPLEDGDEWTWSKQDFHYTRRVSRPSDPLQLPVGTITDRVVVEAENRIAASVGDKTYRTVTRVTYAPGLGVVKVESDNPVFERVLLEFQPVQ